MEIEQEAMLGLMPNLKGKHVLDLACGTGRYGLIALEQDAQFVIGVDDSLAMLQHSKLDHGILGAMTLIPLSDHSIDVVLCGLAVGHSSDLGLILAEVARILTHGGVAVLSDFHPFQYLSGARRTFEGESGVYEVEHYVHLYEKWQTACREVGLRIDAISEPTIPNQEMPVVIVYRVVKD